MEESLSWQRLNFWWGLLSMKWRGRKVPISLFIDITEMFDCHCLVLATLFKVWDFYTFGTSVENWSWKLKSELLCKKYQMDGGRNGFITILYFSIHHSFLSLSPFSLLTLSNFLSLSSSNFRSIVSDQFLLIHCQWVIIWWKENLLPILLPLQVF